MRYIKLQLLAISLLTGYYSFGQNAIAGHAQLNAVMNNYQVHYLTDNDMFWDYTSNITRTYIPRKDSISPIFDGSTWMGGYVHGVLHAAAMTYRQCGIDFWSGPIDTTTLLTDTLLCNTFDKFFPIYKMQVDSQKNHLYTSTTMPAQITNWPGNGLPAYHTSYKLAPYQDVNHNNIYDPLNGDYPIMYGDYSIYQINNDVGNHHGESGGLPLGVETHITHYRIDCAADSALWNTLFMHYEVINRSSDTVNKFIFTMWSDFDLGDYMDDMIGCDTLLNMYYVYNGENYDYDVTLPFRYGYHQYLPAFAGVFLNNKVSRFTWFNNTTDPKIGNPICGQPQQYYNFMNGVWKDGTPMTYGNSGTTVGNPPTNYLFSGDPVTNTGWTQTNAGLPMNDMRGQGSIGPFTFNPHDTLKVDFAYVFARDYQHPSDRLACIPILRQYVQNIQSYYNSNTTPCGSTFVEGIKQVTSSNERASIYPNPANSVVYIKFDKPQSKASIEVYDMLGKVICGLQYNEAVQYVSIPLSDLQSGMYMVKIQTNEGTSIKKFVKN